MEKKRLSVIVSSKEQTVTPTIKTIIPMTLQEDETYTTF